MTRHASTVEEGDGPDDRHVGMGESATASHWCGDMNGAGTTTATEVVNMAVLPKEMLQKDADDSPDGAPDASSVDSEHTGLLHTACAPASLEIMGGGDKLRHNGTAGGRIVLACAAALVLAGVSGHSIWDRRRASAWHPRSAVATSSARHAPTTRPNSSGINPAPTGSSQHARKIAPPPLPPLVPFPPLPPFPTSPPTHVLAEPSLLGRCGEYAMPISFESHVRYPGGSWRYFAEWSGLDEQAAEETRGSYSSYSYGDSSVRGHVHEHAHPHLHLHMQLAPLRLFVGASRSAQHGRGLGICGHARRRHRTRVYPCLHRHAGRRLLVVRWFPFRWQAAPVA